MSSRQSGKETKATDGEMVTITLKPIGPSRPRRLQLCSPIEVHDLRDLVAAELQLPVERLKLVLHGKVLSIQNGNDAVISLHEGDTLIIAVAPSRPPKHIRDPYGDEDDDLKFHIPETASRVTQKVFFFLRDKVRIPDVILMAIFSISLKMWAIIIMWFILAPIAYEWHIGPLYILGTGFCIILFNLGQRRQGDLSAYSIFNDGFRELPGTLNADRLDRDIRAGQF
ncbi:hypothetical protein EJ110_NYTH15210 [Nymphaea thermarum]|nr:hypothetical protein EJ110_NYTH15210 [Nymphaea thermarum]